MLSGPVSGWYSVYKELALCSITTSISGLLLYSVTQGSTRILNGFITNS